MRPGSLLQNPHRADEFSENRAPCKTSCRYLLPPIFCRLSPESTAKKWEANDGRQKMGPVQRWVLRAGHTINVGKVFYFSPSPVSHVLHMARHGAVSGGGWMGGWRVWCAERRTLSRHSLGGSPEMALNCFEKWNADENPSRSAISFMDLSEFARSCSARRCRACW